MDVLKSIRLLVTDVDGVLTDGRIYLHADGSEMKVFNARDGSAIRLAQKEGVTVAFLTGRGGGALETRAAELGIEHLVQWSKDKGKDFKEMTGRLQVSLEETLFVGDDIIDLPAIELAGFSAAPSDAAQEVKERVDLVLTTEGGGGAIREIVELILKARGVWPY